ncbi:MAG: nicotinate-nucleotide adenylyltransferase [Gemmatimonadota bacterium]|nr:nicotinate-nucleotide adenylyltransferase [Gemmatimonadota bacterium]
MGGRIGILGGTFDPIHVGHLIIAQEALATCRLDRVLFVPSADPPHKRVADVAPAEARARMVALAVDRHPRFELCRIEMERTGKSYTVETLRRLRGKLGSGPEFYLIIGADSALEMPTWCDPQGVVDLARVTVMGRPGFPRDEVDERIAERMCYLDSPLLEISSTQIRSRIRTGLPIRYWVPENVARFIETHRLYR